MKVYIFDVDGTLTPSRQMMTKKFAKFFDKWSEENKYYLVTGSDLDKTKEQLPIAYIDRAEGIFTCCGNQFYINDKLIYENTFKPPENLLTYLGEQLRMSDYFARCGNHIENRGSMLNFSIVGRNCSLEERKTYFEYHFLGDRTMKGGNDYPLAVLMDNTNNCDFHQTEGPENTQQILEKLSD